jgi:hypothetical protein
MFGAVATAVIRTRIGAYSSLAIVSSEARFAVAFTVEADTTFGAVLITHNIQTLGTSKTFLTPTFWQAKTVTVAFTTTIAVGRVAQTLGAVLAFPTRITITEPFHARSMVTALTFGWFATSGTGPAVVANTTFLLDVFVHQRIVLAETISMRVTVVGTFLSFTFIAHIISVTMTLFVETSTMTGAVAGTSDVFARRTRKAHRALTFVIGFTAVYFDANTNFIGARRVALDNGAIGS